MSLPDFMSLLDEPDIVPEEPDVLPEPDFMSLDDEPAPVPEPVAGDEPEVLADGEALLFVSAPVLDGEALLFVSVPVLDGELPLLSVLELPPELGLPLLAPAPDDDPPAPVPEPPALPAPAP